MHIPILILALTVAQPQAPDTVIAVDRGTRLDVSNFRGEVMVDAWDRNEVRIRSDMDGGQILDVGETGATLRVRSRGRSGGPGDTELRVAVPRWMDVSIKGNQIDVEVRGTEAEINVETVGGEIQVEGGRGLVQAGSIQGSILIRGVRGRVEARSVNEEIALHDIEGEVYVETTNGDVTLRDIRSGRARATTVNGDIEYDGSIRDDGRYAFATHNGDVEVTVAEDANVTVSVSTYQGDFESAFPVQLTGTSRDRQFTFTLGSGRARLELESFNGEISLRRPR